ncbi:phthiocerol/phenolphthiocerol synthesis polyketide synthase type I PpsD [Mycolicibacter senuensis]|uniref:Phthiocerol/phenolphthiocerol synthesis polyketide synthase type I PpsD n=2 Tax=Mycolicibacter senuensis TaxID=386913 RepID=A0A7I9XHB3_9MYCO|nr:phthiocerol/phenolphthiocerol synthesis polyketide synthase type I PpsD [Mycolicibacter senuensis]
MGADKRGALTEQFEKASRIAAAEPIAVVGIGCRFPGEASGPDAYWDLLAGGRDAITEIPPDRWDADEYYDPDPLVPGRMSSKWGGFISDVAGFDADFFGISPREAEAMDPQQRLMLEVAWEALEHAGVSPEQLAGIRSAVMMGVYYTEYQGISASNPNAIDGYSATGNAHAVAVGRIAYLLGLRGPAVAMDSACSSSLVTIHMACQSLRMRESDLALAGGVSLILRPETQIAMAKWGMLSPRGRCHTFDAGADGFVRGEGAGIVVLKRLADAIRDGDRVVAVVRGSAINQDGRSNGLTAPNTIAQSDAITRALRSADVAANSVNLIETHGTGTGLGDPIEFEALAEVYGRGADKCALGAVKTNIGHLEAAAGIAGFIKAALSVQRGQIPPNLHFSKWNPAIDPSPTRLFVPTEMTPWPAAEGPRRAAVSSFGLGGTNAHVVLEQGPDPAPAPAPADPVATLVVSGKTDQRVAAWAATLADWLAGPGAAVPLADVANTLNHHRSRYARFATVCARDTEQAVAGLRAVAGGYPAPGVVGARGARAGKGTVFLYSGQGSQWAGMGRQLLTEEPAFAAAVDELEPDFVAQVGFSLRGVLESGEPVVGIDRIQPVLVGMQLALTALWRSHGVEPDAVIGHSMGEVAAAVVAGALTPADGLKVIATRSTLMARLSGQGAMALLELDADSAEKLVAEHSDITVAVYAAPQQTVIAGPPDQVDAVIAVVDAQGKLARRVEVDVASHHPTVDPILGELATALADVKPSAPQLPLISTVGQTGSDTPGSFDADYWVQNLRNPVRFSQAVTAAAAGHGTFIEVSPHPLLSHAINGNLESARPAGDGIVTGTLLRDQPEALSFHTNLATVAPPAAAAPQPDGGVGRAELPPRPWQHVRYWAGVTAANRHSADAHPLLGVHVELPSGHGHVWQADVGTDVVAWMAHHKVHGQVVMPATGFAEMALAAAGEALGLPASAVAVDRVEVEQMLRVDTRTEVTTRLLPDGEGSDELRIEIHSRAPGGAWSRHAVARVAAAAPESAAAQRPASGGGGTALSPADLYTALRRTGLQHGPAFAALTRIVRKPGGGSEAEIVLPDEATAHRGYRIHPVMLDAALQCLAAALPDESLSGSGPAAEEATYLPVAVESIRVFGEVGRRARGYAELVSHDDGGILGRVTLTDDTRTITAELSGIYLQRVQRRTVPLPLSQKIFDTEWIDADVPGAPPAAADGSWLVLTEGDESRAFATEFADRFASDNRRVITADLTSEPAVREAFAQTAGDPDRPPVGVLVFADNGSFDAAAAAERGRELAWSVAATVRTVVSGWHGTAPRLWLVGRNGLTVGAEESNEQGDPSICALKGLVRVLAYEHPDLRTGVVDLDAAADPAAALITELGLAGTDDVVAWRGERRYAERLKRATLEATGAPAVRSDGAYVLTGGLGGIGLVVARWLIDHGAARIVLNSRSQPSDEQRGVLDELAERAQIAVVSGDLAAPGVAESLVAAATETGYALRGVVHGAAVIDDQIVVGIDHDTLERVWTPKATGALRLHEATVGEPGQDLDWWVGFSSTSSLLGAPGQASYAAASAWLDGLVAWRRAAGLPAITINWGQWSGVGVAQELKFSALDPIDPAEGMEALEAILGGDLARVGVARLRLDRVAAAFPELQQLGYFATLAAELDLDSEDDDWPGPEGLKQLDAAEAAKAVVGRLGSRIMAIMGYPKGSAIDPARPLTELGMDSLMAVRIRNTVRGDFGAEPPVALLLQGASLTDLAADLIRQLGLAAQENADGAGDVGGVRSRAQQRAAARQRAASRRKVGDRT